MCAGTKILPVKVLFNLFLEELSMFIVSFLAYDLWLCYHSFNPVI